jgi:adenylate cyclase
VAAHYEQAGLPEQAVQYYQRAAEVAQRVYANEEAISLLNKGLVLLRRLPPSPERDVHELALQTELGASLAAARGSGAPEVIDACGRAQSLCQSLGKPASPPILRALAIAHIARAEYQQGHDLGDQLLGLAERAQDAMLLVEAHYVLGVALFWQGAFAASCRHLEQAITHYDPRQSRTHLALYSQDPKVICLCRLGFALWYLGYPDQATQRSQEGLTLAQEISHPLSLAYGTYFDALLHSHLREAKRTQTQAEAVIALDREQRVGFYLQVATVLHGWAIAEQGDTGAGLARMRESLAGFRTVVAEHLRHHALILLAEQYGKAGDIAQGLSFLAEACAAVDTHTAHWCEAELHRTWGELLAARGEGAEAETAFERARAIARSQEAKSLELRAATSLARLWQTQARYTEARLLLAEIYGWFSEGFDTPDLRDARALLDQL